MKNRRLLSLIVSPSLILASEVSWAQQAPVFEEVLVTAEKRTESLQNLSQAVTALSADDLESRQLNSFVDLSAIAPGVNVAKNEGFKTVITIRGIGNEANQNAIANPSVSYHLDGVYVASPFALQTDFLDLERIEVLRGPQGTLFGQNSTGGGINVITKAPTADLESLSPQKADEQALGMSYDQIDDFLEGKPVSAEVEEKLLYIYERTQHKRVPIPTIYDEL